MVDVADNGPTAVRGLLPQSDFVVSARYCQYVPGDGPAHVPDNVTEGVKDLCVEDVHRMGGMWHGSLGTG